MVDVYDLVVIIKDVGNFNMDDFNGRLRFQKTIQVLQSFGIDLGYNYNWYIRGPYCPELAKDGFELKDVLDKIPQMTVEFAEDEDQANYNTFKKFIANKKDDPDQLEIASSICFLCNEERMDKDTVLKLTEGKRARFTMDDCMRIWDELEGYGVVKS